MTVVNNVFSVQEQFSPFLSKENLLECRFENDGASNPIYVGYSLLANADIDEPIWYIQKVEYIGSGVVRKRLPDEGIKFAYIWSQRSTYFS